MSYLLIALGVLVLIPLALLNAAYPLSILWSWFIAPLGVPDINVFHAIGIMCTIAIFKGARKEPELEGDEAYKRLLGVLIAPWFALLVGWIVV